jgi:hypothetical protein
MSLPQNSAPVFSPASSRWRRFATRFLVFLLLSLLAAQLLNYAASTVKTRPEPAGFWHGMLHGAFMPCAVPALALGQEVEIYAANNTGRSYKLGYALGVNACGAIFFGVLYRRLHRWQHRRASD